MDPRFQGMLNSEEKNIVKSKLEMISYRAIDERQMNSDDQSNISIIEKKGLSSLFPGLKYSKEERFKQLFDAEFYSYIQCASLNIESCPLQWWKEFGSKYPTLSRFTDNFFCAPALIRLSTLSKQAALSEKYEKCDLKLLRLHLEYLRKT